MVFLETFLQIHKRLLRQFIQECWITWIVSSITGNIPVQISMGRYVIENGDRDSNRSWAKWLESSTVSQFFSSNFWFLKRPSTGILTSYQEECIQWIKESRSLRFQRNAERKRLEERFEKKDGASSPFENNLNRNAGLTDNCTTPSSCEFG